MLFHISGLHFYICVFHFKLFDIKLFNIKKNFILIKFYSNKSNLIIIDFKRIFATTSPKVLWCCSVILLCTIRWHFENFIWKSGSSRSPHTFFVVILRFEWCCNSRRLTSRDGTFFFNLFLTQVLWRHVTLRDCSKRTSRNVTWRIFFLIFL